MTRARKHLVCLADTPYYHITSRCVRRAFLCGVDQHSGKDYEHRRAWIETRIRVLSSLFSIEVCAYAVMSNHYHLVVKLNTDGLDGGIDCGSDDDVLKRWTALFRGPVLVQRYLAGVELSDAELETLHSIIAVYRTRLSSLSWFMKCLNEPIARQANAEDNCRGHFWEARFHSQALCSEKALLTVMAYVDLNPVRANMARTPEASTHTSIKARLQREENDNTLAVAIQQMIKVGELNHLVSPLRPLQSFTNTVLTAKNSDKATEQLPIREGDYYQLVDETARIIRHGGRGRMDPGLAPILERLGLDDAQWIDAASHFRQHYWNGDLRRKKTA
jgi:REP element-mobilizing transposase RayT